MIVAVVSRKRREGASEASEFAKTILEGLAVEDYSKLEEGARAMRGLNDIEGFVRSRSPGYTSQLNISDSPPMPS